MTEKLTSLVFCEEIEITRGYIHSQIKGIREDGYIAVETADRRYTLVDIGCIGPIPITAEMLEKNGWEKEGGSYRWSNEKYRVFIWLKKFSHFVDVIEMDMQFATKNSCIEVSQLYVHLLQHVLRLAGVDKEINL